MILRPHIDGQHDLQRPAPRRALENTVWSRLRVGLLLAFSCLSFTSLGAASDPVPGTDRTPEYRVKAAFIYNFIKYTTWPEGAFEKPTDPFVLTVLGSDPFGEILDATMKGKLIAGRAIRIERRPALPASLRSHIVFFTGETVHRRNVLELTKASSILVIGEQPGDARSGAQVGFYLEDEKVRFEVNINRVKQVQLDISSELLKLARIVRTEEVTR